MGRGISVRASNSSTFPRNSRCPQSEEAEGHPVLHPLGENLCLLPFLMPFFSLLSLFIVGKYINSSPCLLLKCKGV